MRLGGRQATQSSIIPYLSPLPTLPIIHNSSARTSGALKVTRYLKSPS